MSLDGPQLYEDTIASQDSEAVNSLNNTTPMSNTGTKSRTVPQFRVLSFERQLRLISRMQSTREPSCKSTYQPHGTRKATLCHMQIAFYDASRLSGKPNIDGFDSIELH